MAGQVPSRKRARDTSHEKRAVPPAVGLEIDEEVDLDVSSDIKGILAALQHVRHKAQSDGQRKKDEVLNNASTEIKSLLDEAKKKAEKDRQLFFKGAAKTCREYEAALKSEVAKYQALYEKFCKEKHAHLEAYNEVFSSFEDTKGEIIKRYEQHRKKEKAALAELQKTCAEKIATAEQAVKKKKQEEKSFCILRKSLGSFLESPSDGEELDE